MSGFGHRVYKNYDPRAKVIKNLAEEVFSIVGRDPLIEVGFTILVANLFLHMKFSACRFVFLFSLMGSWCPYRIATKMQCRYLDEGIVSALT